jgi:hypothetical protein
VRAGYSSGFALTAGLMLLALTPIWRDRAWLAQDAGQGLRATVP